MIPESGTRFSEKTMPKMEPVMPDNNADRGNGTLGLILGGVLVAAAALFILSGGELGGKKTVQGDADLPPVASNSPAK
jgi:hypothetical protein